MVGYSGLFGVIWDCLQHTFSTIVSLSPRRGSTAVGRSDIAQFGNSPSPQPPDEGDYRPLAAFYGRFSSFNHNEESIEDQLRLSRERLEHLGFRLPADLEYSDYAVSGTKLRRDGLDQLLKDAKARKFDLIVVYSLSRLGRESIITMPILKTLVMEYDIRFVSVLESFDSNNPEWVTLATFYTLQHENYIKELSKNVHRGQEGTILNDLRVGDYRFGYHSVPSPDGAMRGRGRNVKPRMVYQIDVEEAEWVKQILIWYVEERRTVSWIKRELTRRNTPKDHRATTSHWTAELVMGVLKSRKYIGEWSWGLKRNKRAPSTGQITQVPRPESETCKWLRQRPDLRLISDEVFFTAQELIQKQDEKTAVKRDSDGQLRGPVASRNANHLLAGLIKCQCCGRLFHTAGARAQYMACSGYKYAICDCKTMVPRQLAESMILATVRAVIRSNSGWLQQIIDFTIAEIQAAAKQNPTRFTTINQQLNVLNAKIDRLIDSFENGCWKSCLARGLLNGGLRRG